MMTKGLFLLLFLSLAIVLTTSRPVQQCAPCDLLCRMSAFIDRLVTRNNQNNGILTMSQTSFNTLPTMDGKCFACQEVVNVVRILYRRGEKNNAIVRFLEYFCQLLHIETDSICSSIIPLFKEEVLYVFENLVLNPRQICSLIVNDCGEWYNPFNLWNITLPDVPKPPPVEPHLPPKSSPTMRVLQISDIHFDKDYQPGSFVDCSEPLCCRHGSTRGKSDLRAGYWGALGRCDIPYWTLENMLQHITTHENFDIVYWTGDLPPHDVWKQSRNDQIDIYKNITSLFLKYFKDKPVYSALGNHESSPVNSFPPKFITGDWSTSWLYDELEQSWTHWLDNTTSSSIRYGAFYTTLIQPGFRLISINSNYCNNLNFWLLLNSTDPNGELAWLANTLQNAENAKEKVHIIGHIPPGEKDCLEAWSRNYYRIVQRYENTIAGQFYGHTHNDHYQMFYDLSSSPPRPLGSLFISPSVTTFVGMNPGYRIYTMDGQRPNSTRMVLDHETYTLNLTSANMGDTPEWKLEYRALQAYNLPSLFPRDLNTLIDKLETDEDDIWTKFWDFYNKGNPSECDGMCRQGIICALKTGRVDEEKKCAVKF